MNDLDQTHVATRIIINTGHREKSLVVAVNFFPKKSSPGRQVAVNSNLPYMVVASPPAFVKVLGWPKTSFKSVKGQKTL